MFYESEEIENKLKCMHCNEILDVPKTLPCGSTICENCENKIWNEIDVEVMCPLCKENHRRPVDGFPVNLLVQTLLRTKPKCAYDPELYEKTTDMLDRINMHVASLREALKEGSIEDKIRQHCNHLRKDVENSVKERQNELNEFRNLLIDEIINYESTCMENIKKEAEKPREKPQEVTQKVEKLIDEAEGKFKKWKKDLKRFDLDENDIDNILSEAKDLDTKLVSSKRIANYLVFFGEPVTFHKSKLELHPKHIGEFYSLKPSNLTGERIKTAPTVRINYKDGSIICQTAMAPIGTDKIVIAYLMYTRDSATDLFTYKLQLRLYNRPTGALLHEATELHNTKNVDALSVDSMNRNIYLLFQDQNGDYWLRSYDFDLRIHRATQLEYQPISIHTLHNELYVVSKQQPLVHVYDREFKEIKTFGQNIDPNQPYFIKNKEKIQFQHELIFIYDNESFIYTLLRESGLLLKKIETNQFNCQFQVDPTLRIVLMNPREKNFYIYDLNGDLLDEFSVKDVENLSIFTITKDGSLVVNDNENGLLHIY